jgi:hypothetical protein
MLMLRVEKSLVVLEDLRACAVATRLSRISFSPSVIPVRARELFPLQGCKASLAVVVPLQVTARPQLSNAELPDTRPLFLDEYEATTIVGT